MAINDCEPDGYASHWSVGELGTTDDILAIRGEQDTHDVEGYGGDDLSNSLISDALLHALYDKGRD